MNDEIIHKNIHKKNRKKHEEIFLEGQVQEIPSYYGKILFPKVHDHFDDPIISAANHLLLNDGESIPEDLPPILKDLLKRPREELIAYLLEYYTRHKIISLN